MAFLLAPLIVPFVAAFFILISGSTLKIAAVTFAIAAIVAYAGAILFGLPAYLALRAMGLVSVWVAVGLGIAVGITMGIALNVWLTTGLGTEFNAALLDFDWGQFGLIAMWCGPFGAAVGVVLWLIARPDHAPKTQEGVDR